MLYNWRILWWCACQYNTCHYGQGTFYSVKIPVCRLERCSFKVIALTCDGLAANCRLFRHDPGEKIVHKVFNPYTGDGRYIFFFSDPPHLINTAQNAWANKSHHLWVSYVYILMKNISLVYLHGKYIYGLTWQVFTTSVYELLRVSLYFQS